MKRVNFCDCKVASDESYKDPTNLQAKIQKHQAFEAEVAAHSNAIVVLDNTGNGKLCKRQPIYFIVQGPIMYLINFLTKQR